MAKKERVLCVSIPEVTIAGELGWAFKRSGEAAVRTYVVNHPEATIDEGLTLVGIEFYYWNHEEGYGKSADLVFRKGKIYYVAELKSRKFYAWKQLSKVVRCFESETKEQGESCEEVIPVLVIVEEGITEIKKDWLRIDERSWFYEKKS